jgi:hypothetical protein
MSKGTTTLRLPEDRLKVIRAIAGYENRSLTDIYTELTDEYIRRHKETLQLLSIPNFLEECREGLDEIKSGGGKLLNELED